MVDEATDADRPADANAPTVPGLYYAIIEGDPDDWGDAEAVPVAHNPLGTPCAFIVQSMFPNRAEGRWHRIDELPDIQWGSRIPTSPRLEAMEAVMAALRLPDVVEYVLSSATAQPIRIALTGDDETTSNGSAWDEYYDAAMAEPKEAP
jgi:hypothetical protein